jgi:hypothetical protein
MEIDMKYLALVMCCTAVPALANNVNINGTVQARCVITTDTVGVYGNPTADKLTTAAASAGVVPVVRYDVALADYYTAKITHPTSFSSSPSLNDTVTWTGSTSVHQTSVSGMSAYESAKTVVGSTTNFGLTLAGSTWFKTESEAVYGVSKPFPGGTYTALVVAECIAN